MAKGNAMIRRCLETDTNDIWLIINEAAEAYRGVIPADRWHEPYMTEAELIAEINSGVEFWGWEDAGILAGVMGIQKVKDATLIRHAYVRQTYQGRGIGGALLNALAGQVTGKLLVGTWAAAVGPSGFTNGTIFAWFRRKRRTGFWILIGISLNAKEKRR